MNKDVLIEPRDFLVAAEEKLADAHEAYRVALEAVQHATELIAEGSRAIDQAKAMCKGSASGIGEAPSFRNLRNAEYLFSKAMQDLDLTPWPYPTNPMERDLIDVIRQNLADQQSGRVFHPSRWRGNSWFSGS